MSLFTRPAASSSAILVCSCEATSRSPKRHPRIHDLRHTFAVRSLEACAPDRVSVSRHVAALSTYLGHSKTDDTYWYLEATPVLLKQIADAAELAHQDGVL